MSRSSIFFLLLFSIPASAIMNGQPILSSDPIAQVSVKLTKRNNPSGPTDCSGTRISLGHILTAAHCVSVAKYAVFYNGASVRVVEATPHPDWNNNTDAYDFAVLRVEGALPPGPIAELAEQSPILGEILTVAGFGYTENGGDGILHVTRLTVRSPNYSPTEIYLTGKRTGICGGDSGGGHLRVGSSITILGVSSSTMDEDQYGCDDKVFAANVSKVSDWIRSVVSGTHRLY